MRHRFWCRFIESITGCSQATGQNLMSANLAGAVGAGFDMLDCGGGYELGFAIGQGAEELPVLRAGAHESLPASSDINRRRAR